MATTDELNVRITANSSSFKSAMNSAAQEAKEFGDTAKASAKKAEDAFQSLKTTLVGLGIGQMIKTSITDAMNAVESESLFETSLGGYADKARAWSEELSSSLSLDAYSLRQNVGILYTMTTTMGLAEEASYSMATSLAQLANDMASFYNISVDEAFTKLKSGITGEAAPLKALGILVDETTIKQTAYKNGIAEVGEELTQQEKVLARYYAIMEQTSTAQGDLARTIDSPANQLRATMSDLKQLSTDFGMALLPIAQEILPIVRQGIGDIKPVAVDIAEGFDKLSAALSLLESPAVRTVAYAVALIGVMNKLKLAVGGPLSAVLLLGTALAWLVGKFGETEVSSAEVVETAMESAETATDGAKSSAEALTEEYEKSGNKLKSMLAGFDEITKLSGGSSGTLVTTADVENAQGVKAEIEGVSGILDDAEKQLNDVFEKNYTANASISEIGLPDINWSVVRENFAEWVEQQDWAAAWQDIGEAFETVFEGALMIIDGLFGTQLTKWHEAISSRAFEWGKMLYNALNSKEVNALDAKESYRQENGETPWNTFYKLVAQEGVDIKEAFQQVFTTQELRDWFQQADYAKQIEVLLPEQYEALSDYKKSDLYGYLTSTSGAGDNLSELRDALDRGEDPKEAFSRIYDTSGEMASFFDEDIYGLVDINGLSDRDKYNAELAKFGLGKAAQGVSNGKSYEEIYAEMVQDYSELVKSGVSIAEAAQQVKVMYNDTFGSLEGNFVNWYQTLPDSQKLEKIQVNTSEVSTPATASDIYSIMQSTSQQGTSGAIQIHNTIELDGEPLKQWTKSWQSDDISITNGRQ